MKIFSKYNGLNRELFSKYADRIKFISETTEIDKNVFLVANIQNKYPLTTGNKQYPLGTYCLPKGCKCLVYIEFFKE